MTFRATTATLTAALALATPAAAGTQAHRTASTEAQLVAAYESFPAADPVDSLEWGLGAGAAVLILAGLVASARLARLRTG
jgi:hypothetical protein